MCVPLTESAAYDIVVDIEGELKRVQCKYCGSDNNEVGLRRIHSNSKGYVVNKYEVNSYDVLYVLRKDGEEFLFTEDLSGRSTVRANKEKDKLATVLGA